MSEGSFSTETEVKVKKTSLYGCYMVFLQDLLLPRQAFNEDFTPPPIFKKLENTFAPPKKFDELKESFRKIFTRRTGENRIYRKEKLILEKWYGLIDGQPFYEMPNIFETTQKLAEELRMSPRSVREARNRVLRKLTKPENFNLLPEEVKLFLSPR